ncbi:ComGF family competence protein [Ectobacillus sp. SYSU M60031]|uniref:ComGF family competence protein n=2 Tax=Ectobacillus ponti TaxID=2961894 RepID=A0AA41X1X5_9BACI|nr:ComGF family competence protein [Ectobacillus ponti]
MLVSVSVLAVLCLAVPPLYVLMPSAKPGTLHEREWTLFLAQLQMDFRESYAVEIRENRIQLWQEGIGTVEYFCGGEQMVRTVNRRGNEVVLETAARVSYRASPTRLWIQMEDHAGTAHKGLVVRFWELDRIG